MNVSFDTFLDTYDNLDSMFSSEIDGLQNRLENLIQDLKNIKTRITFRDTYDNLDLMISSDIDGLQNRLKNLIQDLENIKTRTNGAKNLLLQMINKANMKIKNLEENKILKQKCDNHLVTQDMKNTEDKDLKIKNLENLLKAKEEKYQILLQEHENVLSIKRSLEESVNSSEHKNVEINSLKDMINTKVEKIRILQQKSEEFSNMETNFKENEKNLEDKIELIKKLENKLSWKEEENRLLRVFDAEDLEDITAKIKSLEETLNDTQKHSMIATLNHAIEGDNIILKQKCKELSNAIEKSLKIAYIKTGFKKLRLQMNTEVKENKILLENSSNIMQHDCEKASENFDSEPIPTSAAKCKRRRAVSRNMNNEDNTQHRSNEAQSVQSNSTNANLINVICKNSRKISSDSETERELRRLNRKLTTIQSKTKNKNISEEKKIIDEIQKLRVYINDVKECS